MKFAQALVPGRLVRRYKRFLADVELEGGGLVTAACPNTGSMLGCCEPGSRVWLSGSDSPTRKYRHTWELVEARPPGRGPGVMVGINTGLPNRLVAEAIEAGVIAELGGYAALRREVPFGEERSRIDLVLESPSRPACFVEVKNVTAAVEAGVALFPDAVSARGTKHLRELVRLKAQGLRPVLVFCVQRGDVDEVRPADAIDPLYGATLREAVAAGVEVMAWRAKVTTREITLGTRIPVTLP
ncbi:MAG TPA: DNA/RNA nuclease SfsA [Usitatibacteraceae bacterium]|nr:DNA/RNA nuclease SfsA [Usitatibacteraceae bacterium]HQY45854.1 DNA/RNA nuclease SfsA [Usitatibacteraceae bacterium]HRA22079.1 DNA/RNA nuclease SfsA [Usitatibacteraceae bacterium]